MELQNFKPTMTSIPLSSPYNKDTEFKCSLESEV